MKFELFVIGHENWLVDRTCFNLPFPNTPIYLNDLGLIGDLASNQLSESRFFLSERADDVKADYIGVMTYRVDHKFRRNTPLYDIHKLDFQPDTIWAPCITESDWHKGSERYHPGIASLMTEVANENGLLFDPLKTSFWCNNFIMKRELYQAMLAKWREVFHKVHSKYGLNLPFTNNLETYNHRIAGFLYERLTMMIVSHLFPEIKINLIP